MKKYPRKQRSWKEEYVDEDTGEIVQIQRKERKRIYTEDDILNTKSKRDQIIDNYFKSDNEFQKVSQSYFNLMGEIDEVKSDLININNLIKDLYFEQEQSEVNDTVANKIGGELNDLENKKNSLIKKLKSLLNNLEKIESTYAKVSSRRDKSKDRLDTINKRLKGMGVNESYANNKILNFLTAYLNNPTSYKIEKLIGDVNDSTSHIGDEIILDNNKYSIYVKFDWVTSYKEGFKDVSWLSAAPYDPDEYILIDFVIDEIYFGSEYSQSKITSTLPIEKLLYKIILPFLNVDKTSIKRYE